jgi:hypothetical protein
LTKCHNFIPADCQILKSACRPQKSGRKLQLICQAPMKRTIKILICVTLSFTVVSANGQQPAFQDFEKISSSRTFLTKSSEKKFLTPLLTSPVLPLREILQVSQSLPADQYTRNFGFFCKEELHLQKRSGVNFSLRLGTLDYCNFLEGKTRTIISRQ